MKKAQTLLTPPSAIYPAIRGVHPPTQLQTIHFDKTKPKTIAFLFIQSLRQLFIELVSQLKSFGQDILYILHTQQCVSCMHVCLYNGTTTRRQVMLRGYYVDLFCLYLKGFSHLYCCNSQAVILLPDYKEKSASFF